MNESRATRYQRFRRRARAAVVAAVGVALGTLAFTSAGPGLAAWAGAAAGVLPGGWAAPVALLVFAVSAAAIVELVALPVRLYASVGEARLRGVPVRAVGKMLAAEGRAMFAILPIVVLAASTVHVSVLAAGPSWWLVAGALLAAGWFMAHQAAPAVVGAIARARPVDKPALVARLSALSREARVPVSRVEQLPVDDSDDATAFVAGLGRSRRVFLASTMVQDWSEDEVTVVVAHELAHHRYGDLIETLALDALVLALGLGLAELAMESSIGLAGSDRDGLAALPLIACVAGAVWLVASPARHALSRRHERRADEFALALTGAADAFSTVVRRLAARQLAEEGSPRLVGWLTSRHPPVAERLALADRHRARRASEGGRLF